MFNSKAMPRVVMNQNCHPRLSAPEQDLGGSEVGEDVSDFICKMRV